MGSKSGTFAKWAGPTFGGFHVQDLYSNVYYYILACSMEVFKVDIIIYSCICGHHVHKGIPMGACASFQAW